MTIKAYRPTADKRAEDNHVGKPIPANIEIIWSKPLFEVLKDAAVVVGHNTTAILEMAMGKPCILPHYEEATLPDFNGRLIDFGDGVTKANSPEELEALVMSVLSSQKQKVAYDQRHKSKLDQWVGNTDGKASLRFSQLIESEIKKINYRP